MTDQRKEAALAFLKEHSLGVLATVSAAGEPRARTVYYSADDTFDIFFLTLAGTRKTDDIASNPHAAFVVSAEEVPQTLQIEGIVSDLTDTAVIDPAVMSLARTLMARGSHFSPLTHFDTEKIRFYRLSPTWVRWGDFTAGESTDEVLSVIPL